ncbi:MAG: DUF1501 domain-containing protein [Proteobacteria bacterium]|nr:DUF1501 domain-containing protein [Pseudomonadota bacterium]MDA0909451.1 DUF1501 domain-containing protein [Pseudomonadota bacterium]
MISRRLFLKTTGASLALAGIPISGHTRDLPNGNIVVIILEGGMDGLAAVPPLGDPDLERHRKALMATNPISLNPFFGLHPALGGYAGMLANNEATIIHATNFPYTRRSHFEGQNVIESGNLTPFADRSGWIGRALDLAQMPGRALSIDMPLIIRGNLNNDNYYPASLVGSSTASPALMRLLSRHHQGFTATAFEKLSEKYAYEEKAAARDPVSLAKYAGRQLRNPQGPSAAVLRVNDFDTHANQGSDKGQHSRQLSELDDIFLGLKSGLKDEWKNTIILTLTEFGRTVKINGTVGTDHGFASAGLLAGGMLKKGQILTEWPGLANKYLFEKRDLQSTIDYRSVCAAAIEKAYGLDHNLIADKVFYTPALPRLTDKLFL